MYLGKRPSMKSQSLVGTVTAASRFEDIRTSLEDRMAKSVRSSMQSESLKSVTDDFLVSIRRVSHLSALIQLAAFGTACAPAFFPIDMVPALTTSAALVAASIGLLTQGDQRALSQFLSVWGAERIKLDKEVEAVCSKELQKVHKRILDGVAPYTRYVETEQERIQGLLEDCDNTLAFAQALRNRVKRLRHQ